MKTTFLTIVLVIAQTLSVQAISLNEKTTENSNITKEHLTEIFEWTVTTKSGVFSGTSKTLSKANKMVGLVSQGEPVLEEKIVKYTVLKSDFSLNKHRKYYWEVIGSQGNAKGFASTKHKALQMVELVSNAHTITYKIVEFKK